MKDLGRDARELLAAAAGANSAPAAIRLRARKRLVGAMAAGTITTSAVVAKGAWLAASSASINAGVAVGAGTSLAATLVSAVVIGLSTGLVAVSPTSKVLETPRMHVQAPPVEPSIAAVPGVRKAATAMPQATTPVATAPTVEADEVVQVEESPVAVPPAVAAPPKPTKASIARETELLAEVQRALKSGRALMALATLDRYGEECPAGVLYEEATASRVVALCALGRVQDGRRWAEEFQRRYPNSPLLSRVRGACPRATKPPSGDESTNE